MKLLRLISQELSKSIRNVSFIACVLLVTLLCFTSNAYTESIGTGVMSSYSVIELLLTFSRAKLIALGAFSGSAQFTFLKGMGEYCYLFMPLIAAASFAPNFCSERATGLIRFELIRTGKRRFFLGKLISAMLTGGCIVFAGFALYGGLVSFLFPHLSRFADAEVELSLLAAPSMPSAIVRALIGAFCYGAVSVLPAFFLSALFRNPYIVSCLPFVVIYIKSTAVTRMMQDNWTLDIGFLQTYAIQNIAFGDRNARLSAVYLAVCTVLVLVGYSAVMTRRVDIGE